MLSREPFDKLLVEFLTIIDFLFEIWLRIDSNPHLHFCRYCEGNLDRNVRSNFDSRHRLLLITVCNHLDGVSTWQDINNGDGAIGIRLATLLRFLDHYLCPKHGFSAGGIKDFNSDLPGLSVNSGRNT